MLKAVWCWRTESPTLPGLYCHRFLLHQYIAFAQIDLPVLPGIWNVTLCWTWPLLPGLRWAETTFSSEIPVKTSSPPRIIKLKQGIANGRYHACALSNSASWEAAMVCIPLLFSCFIGTFSMKRQWLFKTAYSLQTDENRPRCGLDRCLGTSASPQCTAQVFFHPSSPSLGKLRN